jgi:hypothetical protein
VFVSLFLIFPASCGGCGMPLKPVAFASPTKNGGE